MSVELLRAHAARCFRSALTCPDTEFAADLIGIGLELREEADRCNRGVRNTAACALPAANSSVIGRYAEQRQKGAPRRVGDRRGT